MYQETASNILKGILNAYREGAWLPGWSSPGYRNKGIGGFAGVLFTDAYIKGITDFDSELAYQAMKKDAIVMPPKYAPGRDGLNYYNQYHYIPYPEFSGATTKTMSYAFQDFCIWRLGKELGKTDDISEYKVKSLNYRYLLDEKIGFARGKNKEGLWHEPFDPLEWGGPFEIGNAWQNTWMAVHDVEGLTRALGGKDRFDEKLDSLFLTPSEFKVGSYKKVIHQMTEMVLSDLGQYAHSCSNTRHISYLYNYTGNPWKTQQRVRQISNKLYRTSPDGYSGDDDNGQLSSWYVFSAMGFYPVCPGSAEYALGAPIFRKVTMQLENGNQFVIEAPENSNQNFYVEEMELNGNKYDKNFISHFDIMNGGKLKFDMDNKPNKRRGRDLESSPFSLSNHQNLID